MSSDSSPNERTQDRAEPEWLKNLSENDPVAGERDKRHFAEPHISAEQHSRVRFLAQGAEVLERTRVYLDMKYWIYCRDARAGHPLKPAHTEIWRILYRLTANRQVICPVTHPILAETFKQGNLNTRRQTAEVIDALSQKVAIQPCDVLQGTELAHLLCSHWKGKESVYPLARLVWTFSGWLLGEATLTVPSLDDETVNSISKCIFDRLAAADFSMVVDAMSEDDSAWRDEYDELHSTLNVGAEQHRHEFTSFDDVFLSEVAGILDEMKPRITHFLARSFVTETGQVAPAAGSLEAMEVTRRAANLIYHAYRLKKWTTQFPALHIGAGIHAAVRHRGQPYRKGDLWDFRHAHPALAYCNAFLTEKKLGNLLCHAPLNYDEAYGCCVLWSDDAIVEYLRSLE